ncbi:Down syndrome cell adhesion molecule [Nymphon striatum]|nr:Down syndrome cell adhesion molecule [Nymphon striatum]
MFIAPPVLTAENPRIWTKVGSDNTLTCFINADQPYEIVWWAKVDKIFRPISNNERYRVKNEIYGVQLKTTLIIDTIQPDTPEFYSCNVTNKFGRHYKVINLVIQKPPESPKRLMITKKSQHSVRLSWTAPNNGHSIITKYIVQQIQSNKGKIKFRVFKATNEIIFSEKWKSGGKNHTVERFFTTTVINGIVPDTDYSLRLFAINEIGASDPSDTLQFTLLKNDKKCIPTNMPTVSPDLIHTSNNKLVEDNGYYGEIHQSETQVLNSRNHHYHHLLENKQTPIYYAASSSAGCYTEVSPYATFHIDDQKKVGCHVELSTFSPRCSATEVS